MSTSLLFSSASLLCVLSGVLCNWYVIRINGGKMPVRGMYLEEETDRHKPLTIQTRGKFLADWIVFCQEDLHHAMSPGDVLLLVGALLCGASVILLGV